MLSVGYGHPENHSVRKWLHSPLVHCIIEVDSSVSEMYLKRYTFNGMFLSGWVKSLLVRVAPTHGLLDSGWWESIEVPNVPYIFTCLQKLSVLHRN